MSGIINTMSAEQNYPEDGELILGTVKEVFNQGAFITLDEYGAKRGMLHISEISLKWVRNIRDYVKEGQKVVLQVLKTDVRRGHIDLSLRRVSDAQRKNKLQEVKQRQRVEKIVAMTAEQTGEDRNKLLSEIESAALNSYQTVYECFEAISSDRALSEKLGLSKKTGDVLAEIIGKSIKPAFVEVTGYLELKNYRPNGVEVIKAALDQIGGDDSSDVEVGYISAPIYKIKVKSTEYKKAEKTLKAAAEKCIQYNEKNGGEGMFHKEMPK